MKTKIVYVLTSSNSDYYLEQTLISVYSLRIYNKYAKVVLITDNDTYSTLHGARKSIFEYFDEVIPIETPTGFNNVRKSRFLKTLVRKIISGNFLFVDSDTIICGSLECVDDINVEVGGVPDKHVPIRFHPLRNTILAQIKKAGLQDIDENAPYVNSGVLYVKDSILTHELYNLWHSKWLELQAQQTLDQPPLAWVNHKMGYPIKFLPDIFNCQVLDGGLKFLNSALIIHYFASSKNSNGQTPYAIYDSSLYNNIKISGVIDKNTDALIRNPYTSFIPVCRIIAGDDMHILDGVFYKLIYKQYPKFFTIVEKGALFTIKVLRKVKIDKVFK